MIRGIQWGSASRSVVNNLLMMNAVIFLAQALFPSLNVTLIKTLGLFPPMSPHFFPHQIITYMFLHGGFSHLFFNMFALWMFGRVLEYDLGSKRFLILYMVSGVGAGVLNLLVNWIEIAPIAGKVTADMYMNIKYALPPTIGASGGVFGILLAFGMLHPNDRIMLLIPPIPIKAKYFVIAYGVLELFMGVQSFKSVGDNIAHFAHVGGMLFAFLLIYYWKKKGQLR